MRVQRVSIIIITIQSSSHQNIIIVFIQHFSIHHHDNLFMFLFCGHIQVAETKRQGDVRVQRVSIIIITLENRLHRHHITVIIITTTVFQDQADLLLNEVRQIRDDLKVILTIHNSSKYL
jgi:hypothetical protein